MAAVLQFLCVLGAVALVCGDVYMHNPRGSNNRLNERSANRANGNRMFDSQVRMGAARAMCVYCVVKWFNWFGSINYHQNVCRITTEEATMLGIPTQKVSTMEIAKMTSTTW